MAAKDVEVVCPCCSTRLTVDVLTGRVLRRQEAAQEGTKTPKRDAWEAAQERVRSRSDDSARKLESALDHERTKEARFDELFRKASQKNTEKED